MMKLVWRSVAATSETAVEFSGRFFRHDPDGLVLLF
jgi:hypothetical protein